MVTEVQGRICIACKLRAITSMKSILYVRNTKIWDPWDVRKELLSII